MILLLAHISAIITVILLWNWISAGDENLGGLYPINMSDEDSNSYKYVFNWHPFMMVFGMLFCLVESILSYRTFHDAYPRSKIKYIHFIWQTLGVISVIIGLIAVFFSHNYPVNGSYKPNLYSLHSWIGIAVVSVYFFQYLVGMYVFLSPRSVSSSETRQTISPYHISLGICILFAVGFAIETGIQEKLLLGFNCSGSIPTNKIDSNPVKYYQDIPTVCKKGNWLGIFVVLTLLLSGISLFQKPQSYTRNNSYSTILFSSDNI
jgi:multisubunit Na+/H+ antiporter MnhG subunit